jgi:uncharacterized Fe-S cluster-containing protein
MSEKILSAEEPLDQIGNIFGVISGHEILDQDQVLDQNPDQNDCLSTMTPFFAQEKLHWRTVFANQAHDALTNSYGSILLN